MIDRVDPDGPRIIKVQEFTRIMTKQDNPKINKVTPKLNKVYDNPKLNKGPVPVPGI